jgi:hypothetical protein
VQKQLIESDTQCIVIRYQIIIYYNRCAVLKKKTSHALTNHKGHTVCDYSSGNHVWCRGATRSASHAGHSMHDVEHTSATRAIALCIYNSNFRTFTAMGARAKFCVHEFANRSTLPNSLPVSAWKMLFAQHACN